MERPLQIKSSNLERRTLGRGVAERLCGPSTGRAAAGEWVGADLGRHEHIELEAGLGEGGGGFFLEGEEEQSWCSGE